jgi:hypothetical protein
VTVIEALVELQDVDGRIRELETELKDLPRRRAQETARLSGVSADLTAAKANKQYAGERVKGLEADALDLEEKIRDLKTRQAVASTNKEYQQYSVQIDLMNHQLEATQNNQIAAEDDLPSADARIAKAQELFDKEKGSVDELCAEIDDRIAAVKAELEECRADREAKARAVPDPKFLLYYERLRTKRWPVVVPLTHDGVCDGCHLVQPPSVGQLVSANARNGAQGRAQSIVACTMCGRMLYGEA